VSNQQDPSKLHVMLIIQADVKHYRGWQGAVSWQPRERAVLVGPNNGGKTSLIRAVDLVLNPYRDAYRDRLENFDYKDLDTSTPVEVTVILGHLTADDCAYFEPYLEGRHDDGSFGNWQSPGAEFDEGELVLRLRFCAPFGEPARAVYARPEADEAPVSQADKMRIGWQYVAATLDPLHELAFYSNSLFSKLFERADITEELNEIRRSIELAKTPLMEQPDVAATLRRLEQATRRLRLVGGSSPLDFAVAGLSDRRVLQSLQLVLHGRHGSAALPLPSHGRGLLRVLLLTAYVEYARLSGSNLILAVEEPEQNLEPINQRLVTRSLLMAAETGAAQIILSTHAPDVATAVPLSEIYLVREFPAGPDIRSLRQRAPSEHKFFERHARGPLMDGLYADLVVLVEGPTERGALPVLWQKQRPGHGLDENRIELIDCDGIDRMRSYVRFFRELEIPVVAICDADKPEAYERLIAENPRAAVRWSTHTDWEGVIAAEADVEEVSAALDVRRAALGNWEQQAARLRDCVVRSAGEATHVTGAADIPSLLRGYDEAGRRCALADLMRGNSGIDFKSAIDGRLVAEALSEVPSTIARMMEIVHQAAEGTQGVGSGYNL
jgi:putative ATP-dependent endonuclease of OLD family